MSADFLDVTELPGSPISAEQLDRLINRYTWAATYCQDKDVIEVGCGAGSGLGLLGGVSRSLEAGDYSQRILRLAQEHYNARVALQQFDASNLPFPNGSKDVILLFEAIYYLQQPERFVSECARVLKPKGTVLVATANKDLWEFHPSPHTYTYFGVPELGELFGRFGFECQFFGYQAMDDAPLRQRLLRPVKRAVVATGLMPRTMKGKRWLKRVVFGPEIKMPAELSAGGGDFVPPRPIAAGQADRKHTIIYCAAQYVGPSREAEFARSH